MAGVESAYFKGEGGSIFLMDLPLPKAMAQKVTKGYLRRVNEDGSPYVEPAEVEGDGQPPAPEQPPPLSANKPEWVGYAVRVGGMTPDDAEAMTKQDLVEKFGPKD